MNDEIEIAEYLKAVRKHWIWTSLSFIVVLGAIITYTLLSAPVYEAKSLIALTSQDQANFLLGSSAPKVTTDIETQKLIIQSSSVMYSVYKDYDENTFTLSVNNIKNSNIIEIIVQSNSPENSASIANNIAKNYIDYNTEVRKQEAGSSIKFIAEKIRSYDDELNTLNIRAQYFKDMGNNATRDDRIEYQNVLREITAKNKIYDYLLNKKEEAALTASIDNTNVKVIEYANVPLAPIKPNVPLNIALGVILALGAAFGSAMIARAVSSKPNKK